MKLVSFRYNGEVSLGCEVNNLIIDLNKSYTEMLESQGKLRAKQIADAFVPADIVGFLQGGEESMNEANKAVVYALEHKASSSGRKYVFDVDEVKIEAPVSNPGKIICVGHNYREHILEMGRPIPEIPVVFAKYTNTIIANGDDIPKPILSDHLDYEGELALVVGKKGRHIAKEEAMSYVAGYMVVNDITVRDYQKMTMEWLKGKTFEGTLPMGSHLITTDEIGDPHQLDIALYVNGEERQRSNTKNLVFNIPFLVSFLSGIMTLEPGDIILTGTPGGVGAAMNPPVFLKDGDTVRVEVGEVGILENVVRNEQAP